MDLEKFKNIFIMEAEEHLQKLNDNLLKLEKDQNDKNLLDELMRSSHTIKASSATMGYKKTAFLTHIMEDVFDYMRSGLLRATPKIINELFGAVDALEKSIKSIKGSDKEINLDSASVKIKKISGVATKGTGKSFRTGDGKPIIKEKGKKLSPTQKREVQAEKEEKKEQTEKISHIKVPVERLDALMDLMEELLIDKMRLEQFKKTDLKLEELVDHLNLLISNVQYQVMQSRLVPLEQIFTPFPRMIRDLAQEQKKKVSFAVMGSEIELDRTIVDKLGEPLVHLLRNAIDHGIEKQGSIILKAVREKDFVLISVEDDGKGIDFEKVKQATVKRNILSQREAEKATEEQLTDLLFHSRLSTKDKVTETSGRGVGLSIVKNFSDQIGGRVLIEPSLSGGGARFTLELPITIAIINALLVGAGEFIFAIPFSSIERSVIVPLKNIKSMADYDVAVIDGRDILLAWSDKIFNFPVKTKNEDRQKSIIVVIVRRGEDAVGLVVDKLISQQEIIVKSFSPILRKIKGFSGSTILGDGKVSLIIDVVTLFENKNKLIRTS